ncbi:hypothetical protein DPMN_081500 [Dreissena polymorpha]|uniref:Uncharacterized protein n=1 Tax=Dreissena polymorpha TaxID=45954 RepID=A0A9D3Y872_DREPO|nr:hypothetical protein DPMN_081500 [Dreissena polymorpha]
MIELSTQARRFQKLDPNWDPFDIVDCFQWDFTTTDDILSHKTRSQDYLSKRKDTGLQKVYGIWIVLKRYSVKVFRSHKSSFSKGLAPVTGLQRRC